MLVLGRRVNEKIRIDKNIEITVLGIEGPQIRIGIKAPKNIPVHRGEIYEKINQSKTQKEVVE